MDLEDPICDLKYVDMWSEFQDLGVEDALDVYSLGVTHLATFGFLDPDRAHRLHKYTQDKVLTPLGLMKTRLSEEPSVQEVPAPTQAVVKQATQDDIEDEDAIEEGDSWPIKDESHEVILEWLAGVRDCEREFEERIEEEEVIELESTHASDESEGEGSDVSHEI